MVFKEKKGADKRRAEAAKARKATAAAAAAAKAAAMWEAREVDRTVEHNGREAEDPKLGAVKKREKASQRRDEVSDRKAENRRQAQLEEEELEKRLSLKKPGREKVTKVTAADLQIRREQQQESIRRKIEEKISRITVEEKYKRMVEVRNTNKDESVIDAHTIDEALNQLSIADDYMKDSRLRALHRSFEEDQLPRLKQEKPGLSDSQYKDMLWKMWKRSGYTGEKASVVSSAQKNSEERNSRKKSLVLESL